MSKVALLMLNRTPYALRVEAIEHIVQTPRLFPLPLLRRGFVGVFLHMEKPIPIFDLWSVVGERGDALHSAPTYTILCGTEFGLIGVPADQIVRIVDSEKGKMVAAGEGLETRAFHQVFLYEGVRYPLLDIEALVASTYR